MTAPLKTYTITYATPTARGQTRVLQARDAEEAQAEFDGRYPEATITCTACTPDARVEDLA